MESFKICVHFYGNDNSSNYCFIQNVWQTNAPQSFFCKHLYSFMHMFIYSANTESMTWCFFSFLSFFLSFFSFFSFLPSFLPSFPPFFPKSLLGPMLPTKMNKVHFLFAKSSQVIAAHWCELDDRGKRTSVSRAGWVSRVGSWRRWQLD